MYFNYRLKGDDSIRPVRVFDDGKKTYIQISETAKNRGPPACGIPQVARVACVTWQAGRGHDVPRPAHGDCHAARADAGWETALEA